MRIGYTKKIKDLVGDEPDSFYIDSDDELEVSYFDFYLEEWVSVSLPISDLYKTDKEINLIKKEREEKLKAKKAAEAEKREKDLEERELDQLAKLKAKYEGKEIK